MNILEQKNIRSPAGKDDICAKFTIDDTGSPYVLHDVAEENQEYTLSFWCYSETDGEITAGGLDMSTSTEWTRYVVTFISDSVDVPIYFNIAGTYHIYNAQLEIGCKATDFALNPADTELSLAELTVIVESHTTEFTVMDGKIAALVAEDVSIRGEYDTLVSRTTEMQADLDGITTRVSLTESELGTVSTVANQTAEKFTWIVSSGTDKTNFTLTDRTATLIAETISLNGNVKVNGDMIVDGSITADKIDVADLFAQDITATNLHITGSSIFEGSLNGATGTFEGEVFASSLSAYKSIYLHNDSGQKITVATLMSDGKTIRMGNVTGYTDVSFFGGISSKTFTCAEGATIRSGLTLRPSSTSSVIGGVGTGINFYWSTASSRTSYIEESETGLLNINSAKIKNGVITCASLSQTSDEREKDITPFNSADYNKLFMSLEPISYRWRFGEDKRIRFGIGAQSAYQRLADAGFDPNDYSMVNYDVNTASKSGYKDQYSVDYQFVDMLTMMQTQKNTREIERLIIWKNDNDFQLQQAREEIVALKKEIELLKASA